MRLASSKLGARPEPGITKVSGRPRDEEEEEEEEEGLEEEEEGYTCKI